MMMLPKTGVFCLLASLTFFTFDRVESIPLNFFEKALNWVSQKVGAYETDKSSLTVHVDNADKIEHMIISIDNPLSQSDGGQIHQSQEAKRTNLLELAKNLNLTTLIAKAEEAGIEDVLDHEGPFTLFAPTNEAFERRPSYCDNVDVKDLMKFHVGKGSFKSSSLKNNFVIPALLSKRGVRINIYGDIITANGRKVIKPDNTASNGVLHVIDNVMCAVYKGSATFEINRCPALSILTKALKLTNLDQVLDSTSLFTVFAPTDSAFKNLPPGVLDGLLKNITALKEVLLYHVVPDVAYSLSLKSGQTLKTAQGQTVKITIDGDKVEVNDATVTIADATVSNGVVHSIDKVLIPKLLRDQILKPKGTSYVKSSGQKFADWYRSFTVYF